MAPGVWGCRWVLEDHCSGLRAITLTGSKFDFCLGKLGRIRDPKDTLPLHFWEEGWIAFLYDKLYTHSLFLSLFFSPSVLNKRPTDIRWATVKIAKQAKKPTAY